MPAGKWVTALATGIVVCLGSMSGVASGSTTGRSGYVVVYRNAVTRPSAATDALERRLGFQARFRYGFALKGFAAALTARQLDRIRNNPNVAFVSADRPVHAVGTVSLVSGEPLPPTGVRRVEAASSSTAREASTVNVAVIDTGIDLTHPDFNGPGGTNVASGTNCMSGASPNDDNGHGSHVAGIIGAQNNGAGVVGVAPGTRMYAVKVLDASGSGTTSSVVCGIDWVTQHTASLNIKVANMSLGGTGFADGFCGQLIGDAMNQAICNSTDAGVTYVVAAGNSASDFSTFVPAAYPEVLTVTAMSDSNGSPMPAGAPPGCRNGESDDTYASFSNYADPIDSGGQAHMIAGPGVCIDSDWKSGGYATASGTSMATPHVTGSVALCLGEKGASGPCTGLSPAQIIDKMRADAASHTRASLNYGFVGDPSHPVSGSYFGYLVWDGPIGTPVPPPGPAPDFTLSASPGSQTVNRGGSTTYSVTVSPQNGFTGSVSLSASGQPARTSVSFSPNPTTGSSTMTVKTNRKTPTGSSTITVTGTSGALSRTTTVQLTVG